ncbi:MAG: 1-acyl-sn-glycerol-3-phosphate acyltransferase [Oscillospiraceae bacterium]|nr:1-acyl-sn-glycerol-3-phosphate acyltransferase [Oscillospiraceae bacterium]
MKESLKKQNKNETFYRILLPIIWVIFKVFFRPKVSGKEKIPKKGATVFAINHRDTLDPIIVMTSTWRPIHFLAKESLYESPFGWLFHAMACIYVDRTAHDGAPLREAIECLEEGKAVGVFPEGTRNRTHDLIFQDFKYGTVSMAQKTGAVVVPCVVTGKFVLFSDDLMIRFGEPMKIEPGSSLEDANRVLRERMTELWYENLKETGRSPEQEFALRKEYKKALEKMEKRK